MFLYKRTKQDLHAKYLIDVGSEWPSEVENRLALSVVAASILGGESDNVNKWECVGDVYPEKEGAPKSLREMEWYMLDYVGSVNVSADDSLCGKLGDEYQKRGKKCDGNAIENALIKLVYSMANEMEIKRCLRRFEIGKLILFLSHCV